MKLRYKMLYTANVVYFVGLIATYFLQYIYLEAFEGVFLSVLFSIFSFLPLVLVSVVFLIIILLRATVKKKTKWGSFGALAVVQFEELIYLIFASIGFSLWLIIEVILTLALAILNLIASRKNN
ncbi:MAG: hypothetical protein IJW47_00905 [Clostridia bacterium]|nr:hypothetical protein [Clostridia bacterium]